MELFVKYNIDLKTIQQMVKLEQVILIIKFINTSLTIRVLDFLFVLILYVPVNTFESSRNGSFCVERVLIRG